MFRATTTTTLAAALLTFAWGAGQPASGQSADRGPAMESAAAAWSMPDGYRDVQLATLESQRAFLHAMADSMPEDLYGDVDNPGQRSFAEHVYHAAVVNAQAVDRFLEGPDFTSPDPESATTSRSGLKDAIDASYAYMRARLEAQSGEERSGVMQFAGGEIPGWQLWDELNEHTYWTLGEVVGNFRHAGMAPPAFRFF